MLSKAEIQLLRRIQSDALIVRLDDKTGVYETCITLCKEKLLEQAQNPDDPFIITFSLNNDAVRLLEQLGNEEQEKRDKRKSEQRNRLFQVFLVLLGVLLDRFVVHFDVIIGAFKSLFNP